MPQDQPLPTAPQGELMLRIVARPADTSAGDSVFGGWVLDHMDMAASMYAFRHVGHQVATIAVEKVRFFEPLIVTDEVSLHARVMRIGRTSMDFEIEVWVRGHRHTAPVYAAVGLFTMVTVDSSGAPTEIKNKNF